MEPKHTPGEWFVVESDEAGKEFKVNTKKPRNSVYADADPGCGGGAASNGNDWICSVWTGKTGKRYSGGHFKRTLTDFREAQANAHLIAAAPTLLKSLQNMLVQFGGMAESCIEDGAREAIEQAKSVINKLDYLVI